MATIVDNKKDGRVVSYRFRACLGRYEQGKQVARYTTWKPPEELSKTKVRKAAQISAAEWELALKTASRNPKSEMQQAAFTSFVRQIWFPLCINNGEKKPKTVSFYQGLNRSDFAFCSREKWV